MLSLLGKDFKMLDALDVFRNRTAHIKFNVKNLSDQIDHILPKDTIKANGLNSDINHVEWIFDSDIGGTRTHLAL